MDVLMTRDEFRRAVLSRDGHCCVICGDRAIDAYHIMERRLWDDGGYYLDNGASLCTRCHLKAERTLISPDEIRRAVGIERVLLPPHLYDEYQYDKWGNVVYPDGTRDRGELFWDPLVQKALAAGQVLRLFRPYVKHPRVYHLPWSERITSDDRAHQDVAFLEGRQVVVTEKMDGEQTTIYGPVPIQDESGVRMEAGYVHARSTKSESHWSRTYVRSLAARIGWDIPEGWRICGENLQGVHTIRYDDLPSWYLVWAIYDERNQCLSWDDTVEWASLLGLVTVPVLYRGVYDDAAVRACDTGRSRYGERQEGYVVRRADAFPMSAHRWNVAKFVSASFVIAPEARHWRTRRPEYNGLGVETEGGAHV